MGKNQYLNHFRNPEVVPEDGATVVDTRGCVSLTIISGAGTTATYSRVDSIDAAEHDADTATVAAGTRETLTVDWPYFRVSTSGGSARIAVV